MKHAKRIVTSAALIGASLYFAQCVCHASTDVTPQQPASAPATVQQPDSKGDAPIEQTPKPQTKPSAIQKPKVYTQQVPEGQLIADFGVTTGKPIDSGFVFFDGRYIEAPYIVMRRGIAIYINNQRVQSEYLPEREPPSGDIDPKLPPEITKDTSQYDEVFKEYMLQKRAYVQKHHTIEEERKIIEKVFRSLPFVKEAKKDPSDPNFLLVTKYDGSTESWQLAAFRRGRFRKYDRETVLARAEAERERFEKRLAAGSRMFLFSKGGRISVAVETFPKMVEILRSKASVDEKFKKLREMGLSIDPDTPSAKLVTDFSASSQLEDRLKALVKSRGE